MNDADVARDGPAVTYGKTWVDAQKSAIVDRVAAGDAEGASHLVDALVAHQKREGRADLAVKTLCDLAKRAERLRARSLAERWLTAALDLSPDDPISWSQLIALMRRQGRDDERLRLSARMVARFPENAAALVARASTLAAAGRFDEALAVYERASDVAPSSPFVCNGRAALLQKLGRFDDAIAAYGQAVRQFPSNAFSWNGIGSVLRARGELRDAIAVFERVVRLAPENAIAYFRLSETLVRVGRPADALALHDQLDRRFPPAVAALRGRVRALLALGNADAALVEVERFSTREGGNVAPVRADVLAELGRVDDALDVYRALHAAGRLDPYARASHALVALRRGAAGHVEALRVVGTAPSWEGAATSALGPETSAKSWAVVLARAITRVETGDLDGAVALASSGAAASAFVDFQEKFRLVRALASFRRGERPAPTDAPIEGSKRRENVAIALAWRVVLALQHNDANAARIALRETPVRYRAVEALTATLDDGHRAPTSRAEIAREVLQLVAR